MDVDDPRLAHKPSPPILRLMQERPQNFLFHYLASPPDDVRRAAVEAFTKGADDLRARIEARRQFNASESLAMRRRIYSVHLISDELDLIFAEAKKVGVPWASTADMGSALTRKLATDVPTYFVERELAIRIEAQPRGVAENDLRDMQAFVGVLRYVDVIVSETQFANLSIQGRLGEKYGTRIMTGLPALAEYLDALSQ